jgi:hypothetical protein
MVAGGVLLLLLLLPLVGGGGGGGFCVLFDYYSRSWPRWEPGNATAVIATRLMPPRFVCLCWCLHRPACLTPTQPNQPCPTPVWLVGIPTVIMTVSCCVVLLLPEITATCCPAKNYNVQPTTTSKGALVGEKTAQGGPLDRLDSSGGDSVEVSI